MENLEQDKAQTSASLTPPETSKKHFVIDADLLKPLTQRLAKLSTKDRLALISRLWPPKKAKSPAERPTTRSRPQTLPEQIAEQHGMSVDEAKQALDDHGF